MGQLVFQATLGGQVNLVGPNTASTFNINVPAVAGNMVTTGDTGTVTNTMLAGSIANAKLTNSSVTVGSTSIALGATSTTLAGLTGVTTSALTDSGLTSGRVTYAGTGGLLQDSANLLFDGTTLTANNLTSAAATNLVFKSAGTTAVTIDTSQRVGVGVTPSAWTIPVVQLKNSAYRASGNALGLVANAYYDGTWKYIAADYAQDYYQQDGAHVWRYAGLGTAGNAVSWTEAGRFDSSGNLLVNQTSQINTGKVEIAYTRATGIGTNYNETSAASSCTHIAFQRAGTGVGSISSSNNSSVAYNTSSDYRLKENVEPMSGALVTVAQLKPVTYKWKADGSDGQGFIAHELQEVVPDCVTGEKDAVDADGNPVYQGIDTSFLVATLTAAIKELKAINDQQAETINALTARVVALEAK